MDALETLAGGYLTLEVSLLIVQILQLQVKDVHLMPRLGRFALGLSRAKVGGSVQAAKVGDVGVEFLLFR